MARVFKHEHVIELAKWSDIPVINGLSDYNHPCQAMADILTIYEHFGQFKGLKVTFIGDGNNVATSLIHICSKLGLDFTIASPKGYDLSPVVIASAQEFARNSGSKFAFLKDPIEAAKNADIIYTDTWTSMGQETESKKREFIFLPYQVNSELLSMQNLQRL